MPTSIAIRKANLCRHRFWSMVIVTSFVASIQSGCGGSSQLKTLVVTGTVKFQGKPVIGANVFFVPEKGPRAIGDTDSQGRFRLMTSRPGDGAVPGEFKVGVTKFVPDPEKKDDPVPATKNELPDKFSNPTTSGFTAKVESGKPNDFLFEITE